MANSDQLPAIILKARREKSLVRKHPWIFSGAIAEVHGDPGSGELVQVLSSSNQVLGYASFSPHSQIRCRMWQFTDIIPDNPYLAIKQLIKDRINTAVLRRTVNRNLKSTDAYRIVYAESDLLPGLIVDQFRDIFTVQFLSTGPENFKQLIIQHLADEFKPKAIFERSDGDVRSLEGLEEQTGFLFGEVNPGSAEISENGIRYLVDFQVGHKTGFYLDQRVNRLKLRDFCKDKHVLDCFSYSGGFTLNALKGGAIFVTAVDSAPDALSLFRENVGLNGFNENQVETIQKDVFKQLRLFRDEGKSFDVIVLDPPKFAPTRKHVERASRGYKDINLLAIKLLKPGGTLFTFSCSGGIDEKLFQQIVAGSALDANVDLQITERLTQASDHPVLLSFPESNYLKGLICQRMNQ